MARTPLARHLQDVFAAAERAEQVRSSGSLLTRRELLRRAGTLGLAAAVAGALPGCLPQRTSKGAPRIVVVGAGLAGLTCAYRLKKAGYAAQIYEASGRIGGRCWTLRGVFADGQTVEHGGQFIDSNHEAIRRLCGEFGLDLVDLYRAEVSGTRPLYYFDGEPYTDAQATEDYGACRDRIRADVEAAGYPTTYRSYTPRGLELDRTSLADYVDEVVPGGRSSRFGRLLETGYTTEYGLDPTEQSALNLLYLLGYSSPAFEIIGESDERYAIDGGSDRLPNSMADELGGQITPDSELAAISKKSDGAYELSFEQDSGIRTVVADKVVLALPFTILRHSVDLSRAGFGRLKMEAIEKLGMGTNSKLHLQFDQRHWETLGSSGVTFSDTGYQVTWDETSGQPGQAGILVNYTGGDVGASFGSGTPQDHARRFFERIEPVLPGLSGPWNGRVKLDDWSSYRWTRGSYACWKVGQYTRFAGVEKERQGDCHFAGEHTSVDFQGYLNGAVESGERAAKEILSALN